MKTKTAILIIMLTVQSFCYSKMVEYRPPEELKETYNYKIKIVKLVEK